MKEISIKRLAELLLAEAELNALNSAGVDNWPGRDEIFADEYYQAEIKRIEAARDDGTLLP